MIPITLGTVLIAEGMLTYFGPRGWLSQFLQLLHIYDGPIRLTHNFTGVVLSLVISGFPFAFLLTLSYVTGIDPTLARAAATLGAGPWDQFRHVYLPLLAPGLAITFCLAFVQAFSVFPSAVLVGAPSGPTRVISLAAYEAALAYARERETFGQKIIGHQAVAFRLADMATQIAAARGLVLDAAALRDAGEPCIKEASMAKLFASQMCNKTVFDAVQIHGGNGFVREFPVERYFRDARITEIYEGTTEVQHLIIARELLS